MKAMKKSVASGAVLTGIVTVILTLLSMISMAKVLHLMNTPSAVSYTHLDVYKRQDQRNNSRQKGKYHIR